MSRSNCAIRDTEAAVQELFAADPHFVSVRLVRDVGPSISIPPSPLHNITSTKYSCVEHDTSAGVNAAWSIGPVDLFDCSKSELCRTSTRIASEDNAPVLPARAAFGELWFSKQSRIHQICALVSQEWHRLRPEPVYAKLRSLQPSLIAVPVIEVEVSFVTAASHMSTPSTRMRWRQCPVTNTGCPTVSTTVHQQLRAPPPWLHNMSDWVFLDRVWDGNKSWPWVSVCHKEGSERETVYRHIKGSQQDVFSDHDTLI